MYIKSALSSYTEAMHRITEASLKAKMTEEEWEERERIKENKETLLRFKRRWKAKKRLIISLQTAAIIFLGYVLYTI